MAAVKSKNRINVLINRNFIIVVKIIENGAVVDRKLTSANRVSNFLKNEVLKIRLFKTLLEGQKQKYIIKIRNRLILNIWSK